jgi:regulator of protease activity HflC (stomatin/prohibitin superfamily)
MEKPLARCFLTKITKMTPGINVKIPAADRIEILAIKTLARRNPITSRTSAQDVFQR